MLSLPFIIQVLGSNPWLVNRPEDILFRTKDPLSHIIIADFWHVCRLGFLAGNVSHMRHTPFSAKHLDATGRPLASVGGSVGYVATEVLNQRALANLAIAGQ